MASQTVSRFANTASQTITATFEVTPLTSPAPTVSYYSDATFLTLVSGPSTMTQVSAAVWTAPVPNLSAQTLYISYAYVTVVAGPTITHRDDVLLLVTADVITGGALCTLAEVKLQLGKTATVDDTELQSYIDAVTAPIEEFCGAVLQRTITDERHNVSGSVLVLREERVVSMTSLTDYVGTTARVYTEVATPAAAGTYTYDRDGVIIRRLGASGYEQAFDGSVYASYVAGFASVPANINLAARLIVQSLWETQNGGVGLPSLADPLDELPSRIAETMRSPRVRMLLESYRRMPGMA